MKAKLISNAIWNVVNGSSSALVAVAVPPFLVRLLTPEAYGAWAVALQIATYVGLFGFGLQVAVGRYVAYCEAQGDREQRDGIVSTAFWFLLAVAVLAWVAIVGAAVMIDRIVPSISPALVGQTQWALVLVGLSLAVNLPASVFAAVFIGLQRSDVAAKIQGGGRIVLALGLIVAGYSRDLGVLGALYVVVSLGTVLLLWRAWKTRTPEPKLAVNLVSAQHGRELASFCFSLTIWNLAMLLIGGLDVLIVGRFDYHATPFFALAVTLVTLIVGTIGSFANALVPVAAGSAHDPSALRSLLLRGSRMTLAISIVATAPLLVGGKGILTVWVGHAYAIETVGILQLLAVAAFIRNGLLAYVMLAIGTGLQRKMTVTPLIEGGLSIVLSLLFVQRYGALGVAAAKIVSGLTGVGLILIQNALRDVLGGMGRREILLRCVVKPLAAVVPITAVGLLILRAGGENLFAAASMFAVSLVSVWFCTLSGDDRAEAISMLRARLGKVAVLAGGAK